MKITILIFCSLLFINVNAQTKNVSDKAQIKNVVTGFYNWYNKNWKKVNAFKLYSGTGADKEVPPFRVDWKEVDRYTVWMKKNAFYFTNQYFINERKDFQWADSMIQTEPQSEIMYGFDYDRFTLSQEEPQWFVNELNRKSNKWNITINGNKAKISVISLDVNTKENWEVFCGEMHKEKNVWKISRLGCDTTEEQL